MLQATFLEVQALKRDGDSLEVARMYVRPSARRLGIGSGLMKTLIREAQFQGHDKLKIWTDVAFNDAHRLYQKFGATTISERICPGTPMPHANTAWYCT